MPGGLLQLVAVGAQNELVNGSPSMTHFRAVYRRHTNFAMESIRMSFTASNLEFSTNSGGAYSASLVLPNSGGALSNTVFARIPDNAAIGGPTTNTITA